MIFPAMPPAIDPPAPLGLAAHDFDDTCSCDSVYHSLSNTPVDEHFPGAPARTPPVAAAPTSPASHAFSLPELDSCAAKDQRSHEHARQKLKKPEDLRKAKRCVRCRYCKPEKWAGNAGRPKQGTRNLRASVTEAEGERRVGGLSDSTELGDEHPGAQAAPPSATIVTLADFVKPARKRSDKQFELIGRPRQVLVMDEFTEVDSIKFDLDEWECVEAEAKHRKTAAFKAPTYATVVAGV